jgi:signal transduction histidine kinase
MAAAVDSEGQGAVIDATGSTPIDGLPGTGATTPVLLVSQGLLFVAANAEDIIAVVIEDLPTGNLQIDDVSKSFARGSMVSEVLDRAGMGDFSRRAPDVSVVSELSELSGQVNRTLDRLEELLSWLRDSADQLAHDFRTPLARASARLEPMTVAEDPAERARLGAEARRDLADITRAMTEAMALRDGEAWLFESVRLDVLAEAAVELYQPIADLRDIVIVAEGEPVSVLGVRSLLQRAVANLVDNAVKFSPDGGRVVIHAWAAEDGPALSVADQGPGMPAGGPPAKAASGQDSHGMGLTFVRAILRRHGGRMTIDDAEPGAVVTARFSR